MASATEPPTASTSMTTEERRKKVVLGDLSADFLRVGNMTGVNMAGCPISLQLNPGQVVYSGFIPPNTRGRITITVVEAKLAKNYGIVRMDPYCRIRVGNTVFETPTHVSAGKAPRWNRTMHSYLPMGIDAIHIEVFDERAFTTDERVAEATIVIGEQVLNGETLDEWYPLCGQQGVDKEGMVNVVLAFAPLQHSQSVEHGVESMRQPATVAISAEDIKDLTEMFPNVDEEVVRGVLEEKRGNKDAAVNDLLQLAQ